MKIVIAPSARTLLSGKKNPKEYPYWGEVVAALRATGAEVIHVTENEADEIGASRKVVKASLKDLVALLMEADAWASIDSFMQHLAHNIGRAGVVVWSQSDPVIFGYAENTNLLKDRSWLRPNQFGTWDECEFEAGAFVEPAVVVEAIMGKCHINNNEQ